ncbi:hypothetical protein BMETH_713_2 [methanotrophic bacterial endosymbiont of Bathymodiolus sp.]|nr:hypothetical protein BMETH_713_2 [methanotrophic bacterial endosymbiont of Bathymodiolus sp.]
MELILRDLTVISESLKPDLLILDEACSGSTYCTYSPLRAKAEGTGFSIIGGKFL